MIKVDVDVQAFQKQQKKLEILEEIAKSERELLEGKGIPHSEVIRRTFAWKVNEK